MGGACRRISHFRSTVTLRRFSRRAVSNRHRWSFKNTQVTSGDGLMPFCQLLCRLFRDVVTRFLRSDERMRQIERGNLDELLLSAGASVQARPCRDGGLRCHGRVSLPANGKGEHLAACCTSAAKRGALRANERGRSCRQRLRVADRCRDQAATVTVAVQAEAVLSAAIRPVHLPAPWPLLEHPRGRFLASRRARPPSACGCTED